MDNEENYRKENENKSASGNAGENGVRYQKVNLYDNTNAFDNGGYNSRRGNTGRPYNRPYQSNNRYGRGDRNYQSNKPYHRDNDNAENGGYRRSGSYRPAYSRPQGEGGYNPDYHKRSGSSYGYAPRNNNRGYAGHGDADQQYNRYSNNAAGGYVRSDNGNKRFYDNQKRPRLPHGRVEHGNYTANPAFHKRVDYAEDNFDPDALVRLNKFLSNAGVCSRRDADEYIQAGLITVNGNIVTELGTKIKRSDVVRFNNEPVTLEKKVYVLLNKPKDYVTTSDDPQNRKTVMDLVRGACRERIYPVGRLDRNTTGVLLLTNDGELASKLTHPKYKKKKIYHVYLDHNVTAADMQKIADGIRLDDGEVHADAIEYTSATDKKQIGIEIHSGRNRIVRRIFESLGYHVTKLDRVYFAGLTKKNLARGQWRYLTQEEVNYLKMGEFE